MFSNSNVSKHSNYQSSYQSNFVVLFCFVFYVFNVVIPDFIFFEGGVSRSSVTSRKGDLYFKLDTP